MASWRKLLAKMVADRDPRSYTYDQAARILEHLQFDGPTKPGSHRMWKRVIAKAGKPFTVVIGLVDSGTGKVKPEYIKQMVRTLHDEGLLPDGGSDAVDD